MLIFLKQLSFISLMIFTQNENISFQDVSIAEYNSQLRIYEDYIKFQIQAHQIIQKSAHGYIPFKDNILNESELFNDGAFSIIDADVLEMIKHKFDVAIAFVNEDGSDRTGTGRACEYFIMTGNIIKIYTPVYISKSSGEKIYSKSILDFRINILRCQYKFEKENENNPKKLNEIKKELEDILFMEKKLEVKELKIHDSDKKYIVELLKKFKLDFKKQKTLNFLEMRDVFHFLECGRDLIAYGMDSEIFGISIPILMHPKGDNRDIISFFHTLIHHIKYYDDTTASVISEIVNEHALYNSENVNASCVDEHVIN